MHKPTAQEIAKSFSLWQTYVDPQGLYDEQEFAAMSAEDRIRCIEECFNTEDQYCDCGSYKPRNRRVCGGNVCRDCEERYWDEKYDAWKEAEDLWI